MKSEGKFTGYELGKQWWNFALENPEIVTPTHGILWFWIIEVANKTGWKEKFNLHTALSMNAIGVKNYKTYKKVLDNLISWGFIEMIVKAKNQYCASVVALVKNTKADTKAPTRADTKAPTRAKLQDADKFNDSDALKLYKLLNYKNLTNLFSEKVFFEFNIFLKQEEINKRPVTEERLKILAEHLNNIAPSDEEKIAVIKQAIAGNYPDFRSVPNNKPMTGIFADVISPPTKEEVIKFCEENGYNKEIAEKAYYHFDNKNWKDKYEESFIESWRDMVAKYYFK
jgi:hypothetical protein